jgi:hypothetical protein
MKRILVCGIMILMALLLSSVATVQAEEQEGDKVSTALAIKGDFVSPHHGEKHFAAQFNGYWHYKWFGTGIDVTDKRHAGWTQVKPYVTANKGPFYVLAGLQADTNKANHLQTGVWYVNRFKKLNVFLDVRQYWAVNDKCRDYIDAWLSVTNPVTPISERLFVGTELEYIHYWSGPSHNWYFIGPLVGFEITKNISIFARLSREWDVCGSKTETTNRVRLGVKFSF